MEKFDYFKERSKIYNVKLHEIEDRLPSFCRDFFVGIESNTSPLTRVNYATDLEIFFNFLVTKVDIFKNLKITELCTKDIEQVTPSHIEYFLSYLNLYKLNGKERLNSNKAKSRKLSSIRSFFKYLFNKEKINNNITTKVEFPKIYDKEIVRLEVDEVVKILNEAESGDGMTIQQKAFHNGTKVRDFALLSLLLGTGIRVSECVGLNIADIDFSVNGFNITRKGGNRTTLYFNDEVSDSLKAYLIERKKIKDLKENEDALFLSIQKKRMGVRAVEILVKKYSQITSPLKKITPHKLRSTFGTNLYRETKDIYVVADVLGHKDVNTTKKHYAALSEDIRRVAATKVKLRS